MSTQWPICVWAPVQHTNTPYMSMHRKGKQVLSADTRSKTCSCQYTHFFHHKLDRVECILTTVDYPSFLNINTVHVGRHACMFAHTHSSMHVTDKYTVHMQLSYCAVCLRLSQEHSCVKHIQSCLYPSRNPCKYKNIWINILHLL